MRLFKAHTILNRVNIIGINSIKWRILTPYIRNASHRLHLLYNILKNSYRVIHVWKFLHTMLAIISFGNHRFQMYRWVVFDRVTIV
jgi:hypothetical protein